jgi:hypothetical protein
MLPEVENTHLSFPRLTFYYGQLQLAADCRERESCSPLASTISPKTFLPGEGIYNSITIYRMEGSGMSEPAVSWNGR